MAAFVGAIAPAAQNNRTGAQSNGLTSNMTALRRFHRKAYWIGLGYQTLAGTLTSSTSSTAVTGTGTKFTTELQVGSKLMKADGSTVIGYVASITSDTAVTLLANGAVAQSSLAATIIPHLNILNFGDSVATLKNQFLIPRLWAMLGNAGSMSNPGQNLGGSGGISSTGTITVQNGTTVPYDYTYSILGSHTLIGSASSYTWGVGGAVYTGNVFTVYFVAGPGQGTVTVDLQDNANTVQSTQAGIDLTKDAGGNTLASPALRIVKFNLGGSPAARKIRVTTTSGTCIAPYDPSFKNTTTKGINLVAMARGGLNHSDIITCPYPAITQGVIKDQQIDFATYEMREAGYGVPASVDVTLPQVIGNYLMGQWSNTDWLFYGQTPGSVDAGFLKTSAASWLENEKTRAYATTNNYAFFDGYTPLDSYETVIAFDPAFDGNHVGSMMSAWLATLVYQQFGFDSFLNLPIAPASANISTLNGNKITLSRSQDGSSPAGTVQTDTAFGLDVYVVPNRFFYVSDSGGAGTYTTIYASGSAAYGIGIIFGGNGGAWETTAGNYHNLSWSLRPEGATGLTARWKDSAATFKAATLPGNSSTVASLPAASSYQPGSTYYATNGRRSGEGSGAGSGCPVYSDGTSWRTYYDNTAVAA